MVLGLEGLAVVFFSVMGHWRSNPLPFMLAAGSSIMLGFHWYDVYETNTGLAISLILIAYSFVCIGYAFMFTFFRNRLTEDHPAFK